jgi:integrase
VVVATVLDQRGTPADALSRADADAIVRAIRKRWPSEESQRKLTGTFKGLLAFARLNEDFLPIWRRISNGFDVDPARHRPAGTPERGRRRDDAFRFIPQPIVDWLMDHLHLLKRNTRLQTMEGRMMVYLQERCGRRTVETVRLRNDCISYDSAAQAYLNWDRAKPPYGPGPRLPIHQDVHDAIRDWQQIKVEHGIQSEWLFPSSHTRQDKPHSPQFLNDRVRDLVEAVNAEAPYVSEVEGADGNLTQFDILTIDPYAFRHAFAQRHADAIDENGRSTFSPEDLQQWMGHRSFDTTMGYFVITARRQRRGMSALPSRRLDFQGKPVTVDRERDGFGKLAVSLGSCTEPMNVAAGGEACALAHACESCPFFLVDPFERDGLASKRLYLQAQIERVKIIAPDSHMIQHYELRVADCSRIIDGIDNYIERLPQEERDRIEEALERMADMRRRATAHRRIDLRQILGEN